VSEQNSGESNLVTYREILSKVMRTTSPALFEAQPMPRSLMLKILVPEQTGIMLTVDECNQLAPIFQKLIDKESLTATEEDLLDREK
jgi:hypothetical protein